MDCPDSLRLPDSEAARATRPDLFSSYFFFLWTSRRGMSEGIQHALEDLTGEVYGSVMLILKCVLPSSSAETK
jgi:hypothetical protein